MLGPAGNQSRRRRAKPAFARPAGLPPLSEQRKAGRPAAGRYLAKQHSQWLPLSLTVSTQVKAGQEKSSSPTAKRRRARSPRPLPGLWIRSSPSVSKISPECILLRLRQLLPSWRAINGAQPGAGQPDPQARTWALGSSSSSACSRRRLPGKSATGARWVLEPPLAGCSLDSHKTGISLLPPLALVCYQTGVLRAECWRL